MAEDVDMETSTEAKQVDEGDEDEPMGTDGGVYVKLSARSINKVTT